MRAARFRCLLSDSHAHGCLRSRSFRIGFALSWVGDISPASIRSSPRAAAVSPVQRAESSPRTSTLQPWPLHTARYISDDIALIFQLINPENGAGGWNKAAASLSWTILALREPTPQHLLPSSAPRITPQIIPPSRLAHKFALAHDQFSPRVHIPRIALHPESLKH